MELADIHLKFNIVREFAGIPLPAAMAVRMSVVTRMDDRSRVDHWRRRDYRRLGDYRGLGDHGRGGRHDSGLGDHNGTVRNYIMRERNRRRRQADNARREAESAIVVVMASPREYARRGRQRKSHNKDFLRVHDLPHLSVYVEHHRPT